MEKRQLNTIVEFGTQKLKVLFSHENKRLHTTMVPLLRDFLSRELGQEVEVVSRFTAWETLYSATDNVFDLVILADSYASQDLNSKELIKQIKKLDQCIPVIQFLSREEGGTKNTESCFLLPRTRKELKPLTHFFRNYSRYEKK